MFFKQYRANSHIRRELNKYWNITASLSIIEGEGKNAPTQESNPGSLGFFKQFHEKPGRERERVREIFKKCFCVTI